MRLLTFILLFVSHIICGQSQTIEGTVNSGSYLKPLHKAHIRSGVRSTRTDRNGRFLIEITESEPLVISHTKHDIQEISAERLKELTEFEFYLTPSSTSTTAVIAENESEEIYLQEFEHVCDYTFVADTLVVLSYMHEENMKERSYINCAITGLKYGEVFQRLVLPNNIRSLKDHPSGQVYLSGPESVVQLNKKSDYFDFKELNYIDYLDGIDPVYAKSENLTYYFDRPGVLPLISHYIYASSTNHHIHVRTIKNGAYFRKVPDDYAMLNMNEYAFANELALESGMEAALFAPYIRSYYLLRDMRVPYAPGFIVGTNLMIMDHLNQWMFVHSLEGLPLDSVGIYHADLMREDFIEVIQDPFSEELYTHHEKGGVHFIRSFDMETGATGRPYKMNKPFSKKVKIYDGYVYYLYQTPIENRNWHLLRERLPFN